MRWLLCAVACAWAAQARAADPELHAVSLYGGFRAPREPGQLRDPKVPDPARVLVDRPNKEVVLVLTAYKPVDWTVTATPKTKLTKVFLGGSHKQRAQVPKGVELVDYSHDEAKPGKPPVALPYLGNLDGMHFRPFVRELFVHTKLPLASFTGESRPADENPIVVNALQKDDRLSANFPQLSPKTQIPKFEFEGTRIVFNEKGRDERKLFGAFTEAGPSKDAMPALPNGIALTVYDAGAKVRYGIDGHDLYVVDIEKRTAEKVEPVGVKPNWLTSITFDAKRGRVLMGGRNGFYEYVPKTGVWTELRKRSGETNFGLAWCKATDTLYAVRGERARDSEVHEPELVELAVNGTVVKRMPLGPLVFPGLMSKVNGLGGRAQLVDLGKQLALLVHTSERDGNGDVVRTEAFLYVIDPANGGAKLAWKDTAK